MEVVGKGKSRVIISIVGNILMARNSSTSQESANFARLSTLLMKEGTNKIKEKVLGNITGNRPLYNALANHRENFKCLRERKVLSDFQFKTLYPPNSESPDCDEFDMTLWVFLARNLTRGGNKIHWNSPPRPSDVKWQHDALRLRAIRNELFHLVTPELSQVQFQSMWNEVTWALRRLGTSPETIDLYASRDLDPLQTKLYSLQVRGQVLEELHGVHMAEANRRRHLLCIIFIFVITVVLVAISIVLPLVIHLKPGITCDKYIKRIERDQGVLHYEPKEGWGAYASKNPLDVLDSPVPYVGIFHSASIYTCNSPSECCDSVKYIQTLHQENRGWDDIAYNFLVGGDGVIYEGRGSDHMSASAYGWNSKLISICFLGNFKYDRPSTTALQAAQVFIDYLVDLGKVQTNYTLYGHCQMRPTFPDSPGQALYRIIRTWDHWQSLNGSNCRGDGPMMPRKPNCSHSNAFYPNV